MINTTTLCFIVLIVAFLSTRFDLPHPNETHVVQASVLFVLLCVWSVLTMKVAEMTSSSGEKSKGNERLEEALKKYPDQCESAGVSSSWYESVSKSLKILVRTFSFAIVVVVAVLFFHVLPESTVEYLASTLSSVWKRVLESYSNRDIFVWGVMIAHLIPFYATTIFFGILDILRPKSLIPFKIQENVKVGLQQYVRGVLECWREFV